MAKILIVTDLHHFTRADSNAFDEFWDKNSASPEKYLCNFCALLGDIPLNLIRSLRGDKTGWFCGVYGNHDERGMFERYNVENLHLSLIQVTPKGERLTLTGIQGSSKYKNGEFLYTQEEALAFLPQLRKADILFTHDSPYGAFGDNDPAHCGLKVITRYIETHKPRYAIHGHQHVNTRYKIGETEVICIYRCAVFDTLTGEVTHIF